MSYNNTAPTDYSKLQSIRYTFYNSSFDYDTDKLYEPDVANIIDCQIEWDSNELSVFGSIVFIDEYKVFSLFTPRADMLVRIRAKHILSSTEKTDDFDRTFVIVRIDKGIKNFTKEAIKIEFMDVLSFGMNNTYISKGYTKTKMSDIAKDYIQNVIPKAMESSGSFNQEVFKKERITFKDSALTHDQLVVPSNINFLSFMYAREYLDGFTLVNSKYVSGLYNSDEYYANMKEISLQDILSFNTDKYNPFYIKDVKMKTLDSVGSNLLVPDVMACAFDIRDKKHQFSLYTNAATKSALINGDIPYQSNITFGFKQTEHNIKNHSAIRSRLYKYKLLETNVLELITNGTFFIDLMRIVGVNIGNIISDIPSVNAQNSGNYMILKIIDKFNGLNFNQSITLGRVGMSF